MASCNHLKSETGAISLNAITILIVSYHFHPSNEIGARRATALARYLAAEGMRVVVVSSFGDQPIAYGQEVIPGVVAIPVRRPRRRFVNLLVSLKQQTSRQRGGEASTSLGASAETPSNRRLSTSIKDLFGAWRGLFFRLVYFIDEHNTWSWSAARAAARSGSHYRAKLILITAPPHSSLLAGAWAARKLGIPYITDLRDPWSDYVEWTAPKRRLQLRMLRTFERWVIGHAAAVTSTGATVAKLLAQRNPEIAERVHVIRNGYDGDIQSPMTDTGGWLKILFAGELYLGRDPFPLLNGVEWLLSQPGIDRSRIQVMLMGRVSTYGGVQLETWLRDKRCASVVQIIPPQPPQFVADAVGAATVLLNLAQQQNLSVPAKTFEQLACGREILLICASTDETARLVSGITGVIQVDPYDSDALHTALIDLYRRHVELRRSTVPPEEQVRRYSRAAANKEFRTIICSVRQPSG